MIATWEQSGVSKRTSVYATRPTVGQRPISLCHITQCIVLVKSTLQTLIWNAVACVLVRVINDVSCINEISQRQAQLIIAWVTIGTRQVGKPACDLCHVCQACLQSFERFTGRKSCPMCRKEEYQTRLVHEGATHLRHKMATVYVTM